MSDIIFSTLLSLCAVLLNSCGQQRTLVSATGFDGVTALARKRLNNFTGAAILLGRMQPASEVDTDQALSGGGGI